MKNTALITGASSGIGKEFAYIHAEKGGDLVLVARNKDNLIKIKKDIEEKYNTSVKIIDKDLSKSDSGKELYTEINENNIKIDILINNAGFGGKGSFSDRKLADELNMIQLNIITLVELTKLFLDDMLKSNSGKILNVSSTASFTPGPLQATYFATKSFVQFFSNAISYELRNSNVTITNLMPGATDTGFSKRAGLDDSELFSSASSARKVAEDGYNGMIEGKMDIISGVPFSQKIMLKLVNLIPKKSRLKMIYNLQK